VTGNEAKSFIAGYIRQSVGKDSELSPEMQKFKIEEKYRINEWYIDINYPGKTTARPEFQRLLKDCQAGKVKEIVVYKMSRFSRSIADFFSTIQKLNELGISFRSATENFDTATPTGRALMGILAVFAEFENETRAEFVRDSMIEKAKKGEFCGGKPPYGYKVVDKKLIIDEKQAAIVREVFRLFLSGTPIQRIARLMNERGIPTDGTAKEWWPSKVWRILSNPISAGFMAYNRRHTVGTRAPRNPPEKHILVEGEHEGIISKEDFLKTKEILDKNPIFSIRRVNLLTGLLRCGRCGTTMYISYASKYVRVRDKSKEKKRKYYSYYKCRKRDTLGGCDLPNIRADFLEGLVLKATREFIRDLNIDGEYLKINGNGEEQRELLRVKKELDELNQETKNLIAHLGKGKIPSELIEERIAEVNKSKEILLDRITRLEKDNQMIQLSKLDQEVILQAIERFKKWDSLSFEEKRMVLGSLIKQIMIYDKEKVEIEFFRISSRTVRDYSSPLK